MWFFPPGLGSAAVVGIWPPRVSRLGWLAIQPAGSRMSRPVSNAKHDQSRWRFVTTKVAIQAHSMHLKRCLIDDSDFGLIVTDFGVNVIPGPG